MESLFDQLKAYGQSDFYPLHMPGHKRQPFGELPEELFLRDITEIDGFDNLHAPEGILLELEREAARLYGAEESFYLVNGSSAGVLAALSAALPFGGHLLMARNCHKSAYHAAYLRNFTLSYLYPKQILGYDIVDVVLSTQVKEALESEINIGAVLITSPSYEGRICDIKQIADIVHEKGIPLIVDEAHGAHLGWYSGFAENSCRQGADLVIHSVHKTMPAPTQTALLHVNGNLVDRERLRRFLRMYQTSSPSYLLMAGIDNALRTAEKERNTIFPDFLKNWENMLRELKKLKLLRILRDAGGRQDVGKLVVSTKGTQISGRELYDRLRKDYHIQLEMASESYVLAMFTVNDSREGYERFTAALLEIDETLQENAFVESGSTARKHAEMESALDRREMYERMEAGADASEMHANAEAILPLAKAWDAEREEVLLDAAKGRIAGDFVNLYPPGVPILVPGERVTKEILEDISRWIHQGLTVQGIRQEQDKIYLSVLKLDEMR